MNFSFGADFLGWPGFIITEHLRYVKLYGMKVSVKVPLRWSQSPVSVETEIHWFTSKFHEESVKQSGPCRPRSCQGEFMSVKRQHFVPGRVWSAAFTLKCTPGVFYISDSVFGHFNLNCVFSFQKETTLCLCRVRDPPSLLSDIYLIFTQQSSLISQFTSLISQGELFFFLLRNLFLTQSLHFKLQQFLCKRSQNSWILMWFQFHPPLVSTQRKEEGNKAVEKPWKTEIFEINELTI